MLDVRHQMLAIFDARSTASTGTGWRACLSCYLSRHALHPMRNVSVGSAWMETVLSLAVPRSHVYYSRVWRTVLFYTLSYMLPVIAAVQVYGLFGNQLHIVARYLHGVMHQNFFVYALEVVAGYVGSFSLPSPVHSAIYYCQQPFMYALTTLQWLAKVMMPIDYVLVYVRSKFEPLRPLLRVVFDACTRLVGPYQIYLWSAIQRGSKVFRLGKKVEDTFHSMKTNRNVRKAIDIITPRKTGGAAAGKKGSSDAIRLSGGKSSTSSSGGGGKRQQHTRIAELLHLNGSSSSSSSSSSRTAAPNSQLSVHIPAPKLRADKKHSAHLRTAATAAGWPPKTPPHSKQE